MEKVKAKLSKGMEKLVKLSMIKRLEEAVEELKEVIINEYDDELVDVVTDRESKTNPNLYREDFINRLNDFDFLKKEGDSITIFTPDMENFDFSGRLKIIESIMHGMAGKYVEINEDDYTTVFGKRPINQEPLDKFVPPKERIYLVRYIGKIIHAERELNKKFVEYPFSNTPPIDIFEAGDRFVADNIDEWIDDATELAEKEFVRIYKGAKL